MNYRTLGRTGLSISEISLGALEVGRPWGLGSRAEDKQPPDEETAQYLLNYVLDQGVNFIDTAAAYWASEERIGKYISHRRNDFYLATKWGEWCDESGSVYDYSPDAMWKFLESSLTKLKTDYIDLYQIHSGPMSVIQSGEALAEMKKAKEQGKIRYIGLSCGADEAVAAIQSGDYDTVQISYSLLDRHMEETVLPLAAEKNIGVIIKDGLGGGRLSTKISRVREDQIELKMLVDRLKGIAGSFSMPLTELAIRFVLANTAVSTVIVGTRSWVHFEEDSKASDGKTLAPAQMDQVRRMLK